MLVCVRTLRVRTIISKLYFSSISNSALLSNYWLEVGRVGNLSHLLMTHEEHTKHCGKAYQVLCQQKWNNVFHIYLHIYVCVCNFIPS